MPAEIPANSNHKRTGDDGTALHHSDVHSSCMAGSDADLQDAEHFLLLQCVKFATTYTRILWMGAGKMPQLLPILQSCT